MSGVASAKNQPFAQVIMSMDAFVATFSFFEAAVKRYVNQGLITQEMVDEYRAVNANIDWKTR